MVQLVEVAAQINRVGNAVGIFDGTVRIVIEEWQKLLPMLNETINSSAALAVENVELKKKVEELTPKDTRGQEEKK